MKSSRRNEMLKQTRAEKRANGPPKISKYSAKFRPAPKEQSQ